ncbi:putative quinol monooxygenase [Flaviflexus equikiangi]|uniref:Antibiotic biosynthesis monooxygenase n=1 Tax=Flaviflexus equikiangi TaxID=2758573 RepID=A0ABS2TDJ3_9ACTO|nr:putative quinol monooxygenase [Flaviflexus equikiangi]MBM9432382.1 antibiotic biosynthesis monooxygenase [Flaviflexus equikiangi]
MIFIVVKMPVKPEYADRWPELSAEFTQATLAEEKNKFFEWSRSVNDPNTYVLVEGFEDDGAAAHVQSDHFKKMQEEFPQYLSATPQIISRQIEVDDWDEMGELKIG